METNNTISYILFRIGVFAILFYASLGCRTTKEKTTQQSYEREQAYTYQQHKYTEAFGWIDSSGRYWTFHSDSAFYYHPDSGLRARQGLLSLWENKVQKQAWTSVMDSNNTEVLVQEQYSLWKNYYRNAKDSKWIIIIGLLLFVVGSYSLYRYLQRRKKRVY